MSRRVMLAMLLVGCGPQVGVGDETGTTGGEATTDASVGTTVASTSTSASTSVGTTTPGTTSTVTTSADTSSTTEDDSDEGATFIQDPDGMCFTVCGFECDHWAQDCPEGEKCMPWANDGGNAWNSARCTPLDPMPGLPGDPCIVEGTNVSGIDSCALGSQCWNVDPETNTGECVASCEGSEANPVCPDGLACFLAFEGYIHLCLPSCDPLAPSCAPGSSCRQASDGPYPEEFACLADDLPGRALVYGSECTGVLQCAAGHVCLPGEHVSGCAADCCTTLCDPTMPQPCLEADVGQTCLPYPDVPGLGFCGFP